MPPSSYKFRGATALVTGAASGMGEQMAYGLAARGSDIVLIDRDAERLADVAEVVRSGHPDREVSTYVVDLADLESLESTAEMILTRHPDITLLINNAGVALGGNFRDLTAEEFQWVQDINFRAPVALTRLLLPTLLASPGSHIVNVSSLFGLIAPPGQCAYAASKFALRGFSEALRHELADDGITVTTVHPGGIRTRIAESVRIADAASEAQARAGKAAFAKLLTYPADKAAVQILDGVARRKPRVLIAASATTADIVARLFPTSYLSVLKRLSPGSGRRRRDSTGRDAE
ncbi:SDR family NAD(P)-dependent oxidoreductase [Nocardia rhizosphaerihabitans]|uniref:SDR family NAD(P)-dependent oxidoreductase n=1 Tax=Nocardia rhizosphaerihabitans TaxID=1691570 RepID=UPI00366BBEF8